MAMIQQPPLPVGPSRVLEKADIVLLHAGSNIHDEMLAATRESLGRVLHDFLAQKNISESSISVIDTFFFIFNEPAFFKWHTLNWWEQRRRILAMKDHQQYRTRARALLAQSYLAPYMDYSDDMVARSTELQVKHAWMRKRLVLKECFWNVIDSVSCAAYFQQKYGEIFPALCVLLCRVTDRNGRETELILGIDNGIGYVYKKKSRESILIRALYKAYKFFVRSGVFYIGGLELGLLETDSELSCHGSGAVVYQAWCRPIP